MTKKKQEMTPLLPLETKDLVADLRQIIDSASARVATTANYELTMMYWHIGERINRVAICRGYSFEGCASARVLSYYGGIGTMDQTHVARKNRRHVVRTNGHCHQAGRAVCAGDA